MTATICTLSDVKLYLGIDSDEDADDVLLTQIIGAVNEYIEDETGRIFEDPGTDVTRKFNRSSIDSNGILWLDTDLYSLTSLVNGNGDSILENEIEFYPENDLPIQGIRVISSSNNYWAFDYNDSKISVTGRWAYSLTVPLKVKQAAIRLAAWVYRQKDNSGETDRPLMTADGMIIMPNRFPKDIETWIQGMRRPIV